MRAERLSRVLRKHIESRDDLKRAKKGIGEVERLLGKNGQNWMRGRLSDGDGNFCLLGAINDAHMEHMAKDIVFSAIQGSIPGSEINDIDCFSPDDSTIYTFNDDIAKEWSSIREVLKRAKKAISNAMKSERSIYA